MKRLTLVVMLALFAISASAQLNVKSKTEGPAAIATAMQSRAILFHSGGIGYVLAVSSDNRYDKPGKFLLGDTEDGAIDTLRDLLDLCVNIDDQVVTVEPMPGCECIISAAGRKGWLRLKFNTHAGICELRDKDVADFIAKIEERR